MTARRYATSSAVRALDERFDERDLAVLRSVSDLRFVSGDQLRRLHFFASQGVQANARAARRVLLRLVQFGVLTRLPRRVGGVRAGSTGFVYRLTVLGTRFSEDHGWRPTRPRQRSVVPGSLFVAHALQIAELHTLLTEADRGGLLELVNLVGEPGCWRSYTAPDGRPAALKPDSYVELGAGNFIDSYFIEVDRGTEGSSALRAKLRDYLAFQASGVEQRAQGVFPKVLWTVPNEERAGTLGGVIRRLPAETRGLFATVPFDRVIEALTDTANNTH